MQAFEKLLNIQKLNKSIICVGLDTDLSKLPSHFEKNKLNSILEFNKEIVQATKNDCCGYKINFAFYEQYGRQGYELLEKTLEIIPSDLFTIADAKRGDIGNTSKSYAKSVFEALNFDSITVSPYMGFDSVSPFLEYSDKITFLLCLTSNIGSNDFQILKVGNEELYKIVMRISSNWADYHNIAYVVGATHPDQLRELRNINSSSVFLIPGIGAQGGDLEGVLKANNNNPAIINLSRSVIYSSSDNDFAEAANSELVKINNQVNSITW